MWTAVLRRISSRRSLAAQDGAMTAEQTEKEARPLTGEEVLSAYDQAVEAYGWFELTPLPSGSGAVEVDGSSYLPVDRQGMTTMLELRSYLRSLFSEDVTNQLLATGGKRPLYREVDGALYVRANSGREKDPDKGKVSAQVKQESETAYAVNATVDLLGRGPERGHRCGVLCFPLPVGGGAVGSPSSSWSIESERRKISAPEGSSAGAGSLSKGRQFSAQRQERGKYFHQNVKHEE
ncbi:MAG: hypothetical protein V8R75_06330 [Oscillospiraceae bacterium]